MGENEGVNKDTCEVCRENIYNQFKLVETRLNSHSRDIKDLTIISNRFLQLQEIQTKNLEAQEHRIKNLEDVPRMSDSTGVTKFYQTKSFEKLISGAIVMAIILTGAAVGQNLLDKAITLIGK